MPTGYLTPDSIPAETVCRVLLIPNDTYVMAAIYGAISELCFPTNWEQFGSVTPEEIAQVMRVMFDALPESECQPVTNIELATCEHMQSQNVGGGTTPAANTSARIPFTTFIAHPAWIGLANNIFTIQAGRYYFDMQHIQAQASGFCWCWLENEQNYPTWFIWGNQIASVTDRYLTCRGMFDVAAEFKFAFWYRSNSNSVVNTGFGSPKNITGYDERYGHVTILRLGETLLG